MDSQFKFSVLISIYYKESAQYFDRAMQSIWDRQVVKPNEIVLVEDGPLTDELYQSIDSWKERLDDVFKVVILEQNVGLGSALNAGLEQCSFDLVARMDTDDISTPHRFERQVDFLKKNQNIDVVGTCIAEIDKNDVVIKNVVSYPLYHDDMFSFFKGRDPVAHPVVMFRKCFFKKAGNYPTNLLFAEDTLLWYKGFLNVVDLPI